MSLRNSLLKHQVLVMRLIRTQANNTYKVFKELAQIANKAVAKGSEVVPNLSVLHEKLNNNYLEVLEKLAKYEINYLEKKLKVAEENSINAERFTTAIPTLPISLTVAKEPITIQRAYTNLLDKKISAVRQIVRDGTTLQQDSETTQSQVEELLAGQIQTQNLILAASSILGLSNIIKTEVARNNDLLVEWSLDLELNNCDWCASMASNGPYKPSDVLGLVPAHARCGCTLIPLTDE